MSYTKNIHEMLHDISIAPSFEKDSTILKFASNSYLKKFLSIVYNPSIEWDLPPGMPPHKRDETVPPDLSYTTLSVELKTLYVYFKPSPLRDNVKRESRFIEMLEALHYTESDLIVAVKDGKFDKRYPGISKLKLMQLVPEIFAMDGIFQRGEWLAVKFTTKDGEQGVEFVKPENLNSVLTKSNIISANNFFTNEEYLAEKVEETPTIIQTVIEQLAPKKSVGRPKKDASSVVKATKPKSTKATKS